MIGPIAAILLCSTFVYQSGGSWTIIHKTNEQPKHVEVSGWVSNSSIPGFGSPRFVYSLYPQKEKIHSDENVSVEPGLGFTKIGISHMHGTSFNFEPLMGKRTIVLHYRKKSERLVLSTTFKSSAIEVEDTPPSPENISDVSRPGSSDECVMLDTEDIGYYRIKEKDVKPGEKYLIRFKYLATVKSKPMIEMTWYRDDDRGWTVVDRDELPIRPAKLWRFYEKVIVIPQNSNSMALTFRVRGDGKSWIDDVTIEPIKGNTGKKP